MADDESKGSPTKLLFEILGVVGILVFLWFATGAYKHADLRGVFLSPPAPLGPGGSYGPQVGQPNPNYTNTNQN
ncbi:MAG TPA: hypothetical protein VHD31_00365 [Candidatus Paceibacterota bacterium]|nr:hypothetical protein [Candidatus Paceibacterota bacterium]